MEDICGGGKWKERKKIIWEKLVVVEEGKNKENRKGKEIRKEKIFSWSPKMKISETQIPGIESWMRKSFGKYRNRPKFKYLGTTRNKYQKSIII